MTENKRYELGLYGKTLGQDRKDKKKNLAILKNKGIAFAMSITMLDSLESDQKLYLIPIVANGKYGFINQKAEIVCECIFDDTYGAFYDNSSFVAVKKGEKWTVIDSSFNELLDTKYDLIVTSPDCSLIVAQINYKATEVIDLKTKKTVVETDNGHDIIEGYRFGYAKAQKNGLWGIINTEGTFVLQPKYSCMLSWYNTWFRPETKVKEHDEDDWSSIINLHDFDK